MSMDQPALPERHPSSDQPGVEIERRAQLEINPGAVALRLMGLPNMLSPDEFAKADELLKSVIGFGVNELAFFGRVQHDEHRENNSLRMANKALEAESAQDRVTGALTQKGLEHAVFEAAIEAVLENKPMFAAYADLDNFKEVNDSLGHEAGDLLLKQVFVRLKEILPKARIARIHGDEFVIVGTLGGHQRTADQHTADIFNQELHQIFAAVEYYVPNEIALDKQFQESVPLSELKGMRHPGSVSIGGVFAMPEDVLQISHDLNNNARTMDEVMGRLKKLADEEMYVDKNRRRANEVRDRRRDIQVRYEDFWQPRAS